MMKKLIILFGILISLPPSIFSAEQKVLMEICRRNKDDHTQLNRAPKHIDVVYDNETNLIKVTGDDSLVAKILLYNSSGEIIDSSFCLNSNFIISTSGTYRILIESDEWVAEGRIEVE